MSHFEHGAIDKEKLQLIDPKGALKRTWYECPDCHRDVSVRKGEVRSAYFAHRPDKVNPCTYYNRNPSLDQQHKNAQLKLKHFLNNQVEIDIKRHCSCGCGWITGTILRTPRFGEGKCEHRFKFNGSQRSADVAIVDGDSILAIFEVVHTHYTQERHRPEPWFEISAKEINAIPSDSKQIKLTCIRQLQSKECIEETAERNAKQEAERIEQEKKWKEERIRREQEAKERDAYHAKMIRQWEEKERCRQKKLQEESEIQKRQYDQEQEEKRRIAKLAADQRKATEEKALQHKRQLHAQQKLLFKKHSCSIARCDQCGPIAAWLNAGSSVGRCRKCEKKIDELVAQEMASTTLTQLAPSQQ
jgi:hypothetical protein